MEKQILEEYIYNYMQRKIIITGDSNDAILSCSITYDLNKYTYISTHKISKIILSKNDNIKKKYMKGSAYYTGMKYK